MEVIKSAESWEAKVQSWKNHSLVVVHFLADWAQQCKQVTDVLLELQNDKVCSKVLFLQVEAEEVPAVTMDYEVEAVPTIVLLQAGKVVDRVNGVKIAELTQKVRQHAQKGAISVPVVQNAKEELQNRLKRLINSHEVMLFMKGEPDAPQCGFSRTIVGLLQERNVKFGSFDILTDNAVRQGLKSYSNWQLYPQVYVNGELIGGLDIVKELIENDEFDETFPKQLPLNDRLKSLVNKSKLMLFMKGDREQPRCGFSRQAIDILNSKEVEYETFDILEDDEVRQGLKEYSEYKTYPQFYISGELVGGLDIMKEMDSMGELDDAIKGA
ncbi:glutaredoxin 3-like [Watersipora subatra]|uniref:glutaredoxin 3-like n=1 Tax=Watersipora subatra TaxID=2589382 RepID=UPI00355C8874